MATQEAKVNTPCSAFRAMSTHWQLIDDLNAGSQAMRDRSSVYLPKFDKEEVKHYNARIQNSTLFSAYADTAKSIVSKPFSKPVTLQGKLGTPLEDIEYDVDGQGKALGELAREVFTCFVNRGIGHILVDYPLTTTQEGGLPNLQQERSAGYRPRLITITPDQLIGWQTENDATGKPILTRIRILETRTEPKGVWGDQQVEYVRVIEPMTWSLYRMDLGKKEFALIQEGVNSLGKVPLITGYAYSTGYMTADPPLKELAETNLAHFRSDSDQRNILHMARTATLFVKGFTQEEAEKIALGPNQIISTTNPEADARFVEHTGAAIDAGAKDIEVLEERMVLLGLQPYLRRIAGQTATGQGIDESRANCDIQAWVMALEQLLYRAYALAAEWINVELPDDFKIDVFNDFAIWMRAAQDTADLIKLRQSGDLSKRTLLREVKRRALLSETLDVDEEIEQIESEGPALGMIGFGEGGNSESD